MDSRKLLYFVEAMEQGSLNRAAARLLVSQPALSKAIRLLETELGVSLLVRTNEGVHATPYGKELYAHAKAVVGELAHARSQIESLKRKEQRQIVIGTLSTYSGPILGEALWRMHVKYGRVPLVKIVEKPEVELTAELRRGAFDFALGLVRGGDEAEGLREQVLMFDDRKLFVRADHPLAKLPTVTFADLARYPWILPSTGTTHRGPMEQMFRDAQIAPPEALIEGGSMHFHLHLLQCSDYIVSLSVHAVATQLRHGQLVVLPVALPQLRRTVGIITREHYRMRPEAKSLIKSIEAVCRDLS